MDTSDPQVIHSVGTYRVRETRLAGGDGQEVAFYDLTREGTRGLSLYYDRGQAIKAADELSRQTDAQETPGG